MNASRWRSVLLALGIILVLQEALATYLTQTFLDFNGITVVGSVDPLHWKIGVYQDSIGHSAGLRDGDVVDVTPLTNAERFRLFSAAFNVNEPVVLAVVRDGKTIRVAVPQTRFVITWQLWFAIFAGFWAGACAIVLALRKPESVEVQWLVLWLVFMRLSIQMNPINGPSPYPFWDLIYLTLGNLAVISSGFLASYAASLLERPSRTIRLLTFFSYAIAIGAALISAVGAFSAWFGFGNAPATVVWTVVLWPISWILPLACGFFVLARIRGSARERLAWTLTGATIYFAITLTYSLAIVIPALNSDLFNIPGGVLQIVAPALLTYAMLNRRLLDIGFALNRAAVFTGVSIVVVGIFMLIEWAFGEWFASATHLQNTIVSGALALALGFSIRGIHQRVDVVLDFLFFRKRHEDEQALRAFAHEAPYVTDLETLLSRTQAIISDRADASNITIVLYDGKTYGGIDENDEAILAMRAHHRVLDLHLVRSALHGEYAYPMVARGRLLGAIAVGAKRSGESYAPDEASAIGAVAHAVGASVDVLSRDVVDNEAILEAIRSLQVSVADVARRIVSG